MRVTAEQRRALEHLAAGGSVAGVVRDAIDLYLTTPAIRRKLRRRRG